LVHERSTSVGKVYAWRDSNPLENIRENHAHAKVTSHHTSHFGPDLERVIAAWGRLPDATRQRILHEVDAALEPSGQNTRPGSSFTGARGKPSIDHPQPSTRKAEVKMTSPFEGRGNIVT
jgi:hypothetical protein